MYLACVHRACCISRMSMREMVGIDKLDFTQLLLEMVIQMACRTVPTERLSSVKLHVQTAAGVLLALAVWLCIPVFLAYIAPGISRFSEPMPVSPSLVD